MKERTNFIREIFEQAEFFYFSPETYDEKAVKKAWKEDSSSILNSFIEEIKGLEDFSSAAIHEIFQSFVKAKEIGFGKLMKIGRASCREAGESEESREGV